MELITIILCIGIIIMFALKALDANVIDKNKNWNSYKQQNTNTSHNSNYEFHYNYNYMPFAKGNLLTKTEHEFFIILVREALKRRLLVCPKVRLEDIIYVTEKKFRDNYRGYIKSRHVDFVLIDKACNTVAAIELDDPSHETENAAKTDQFKNELFSKVGIPLIRIFAGSDYIEDINYAFDELKFPKSDLHKTQP